jgi:hypothetical protein
MDSPLTSKDLVDLGIKPGPIFRKIFVATAGLLRETALALAVSIRDDDVVPARGTKMGPRIKPGSIFAWLVALPFVPATSAPNPMWASNSEKRRMIEQGAIRLNWHNDWNADDPMPPVVWEFTFFPSGARESTQILL